MCLSVLHTPTPPQGTSSHPAHQLNLRAVTLRDPIWGPVFTLVSEPGAVEGLKSGHLPMAEEIQFLGARMFLKQPLLPLVSEWGGILKPLARAPPEQLL